MNMSEQISLGKLRCVRSGKTLARQGHVLASDEASYPLQGDVPLIFKEAATASELLAHEAHMAQEYSKPNLYQRLRNSFYKDYNCHEYDRIFTTMLSEHSDRSVFLSIGGGPIRRAPHITNMNIGPYPNVDIVCDAHDVCYHDETVDAIHCDAVLEHLHTPIRAVQEMHRVLKKGGQVLSVIPFMQGYHGYPHHYQNYTLSGHERLYHAQGFEILASGACQGPVVAVTTLTYRFCLEYLPRGLNVIIGRGLQLIALMLRPLDRLLEQHPKRHVLASSTYVLARKPL